MNITRPHLSGMLNLESRLVDGDVIWKIAGVFTSEGERSYLLVNTEDPAHSAMYSADIVESMPLLS